MWRVIGAILRRKCVYVWKFELGWFHEEEEEEEEEEDDHLLPLPSIGGELFLCTD
jgi:hypothetical protein